MAVYLVYTYASNHHVACVMMCIFEIEYIWTCMYIYIYITAFGNHFPLSAIAWNIYTVIILITIVLCIWCMQDEQQKKATNEKCRRRRRKKMYIYMGRTSTRGQTAARAYACRFVCVAAASVFYQTRTVMHTNIGWGSTKIKTKGAKFFIRKNSFYCVLHLFCFSWGALFWDKNTYFSIEKE